ncbi:hypothetical protein INR77_10485 [Erythrobacter sp. SCSIO 43205]|uniref:RTA1 domain-containing protein n=1 Tax=Erythrobacter sp. SCSIO 43205 TaxID=2779361 RepID=UPI001CA7BF42|nr:RTA1 domain-containing protein [Erythrobacter sp. SCSIO 43205]UAB77242.1 hypothetical protein INR77_10485 [Erythrobacter sp. SCSIO 43205]
MGSSTLFFMLAGLVCFGAGAYLAPTGEREIGIALMIAGLVFQVLTLRQMKLARKNRAVRRDMTDAG